MSQDHDLYFFSSFLDLLAPQNILRRFPNEKLSEVVIGNTWSEQEVKEDIGKASEMTGLPFGAVVGLIVLILGRRRTRLNS